MRGEDVTENLYRDVEKCPEDRRIGRRTKATVRDLVTEDLTTLVEEFLDNILRASYLNAQSGIRSVLYNFVEQVMLNRLRKDVIGQTLNA